MVGLQLLDLGLVLFLGLGQHVVPMLVELLVLLNVGSLDLLLTLLVTEDQGLILHVELLLLELEDAVLRHFGLWERHALVSVQRPHRVKSFFAGGSERAWRR